MSEQASLVDTLKQCLLQTFTTDPLVNDIQHPTLNESVGVSPAGSSSGFWFLPSATISLLPSFRKRALAIMDGSESMVLWFRIHPLPWVEAADALGTARSHLSFTLL